LATTPIATSLYSLPPRLSSDLADTLDALARVNAHALGELGILVVALVQPGQDRENRRDVQCVRIEMHFAERGLGRGDELLVDARSEEHTSERQSPDQLVCRLLF